MAKRTNKIKSGSLFLNYFKPSIYLKSFSKINLEGLKNAGIKVILCDLDNTLISWNQRIPTKENMIFFKAVKNYGFEFIIFSNNVKSRVENFAKKADIQNYFWDCKKPLMGKMRLLKKILPYKENEIIMIGDQLVTDILMANRAHIQSILVSPISRLTEDNKIITFFEKFIYKRLAQRNILHEGFYNEGNMENNYEIL
ncbi:YqeG family HAD IIIA-type phosphatase [Spiroplasma endosymbiont of Labia minor]|uniref:YqeG family HAD IIIA-type phosphatase n=1 Tax=Spiroplasma endosymbiont of Labia minor TaxID=3066305 RepID=UPI0030D0E792